MLLFFYHVVVSVELASAITLNLLQSSGRVGRLWTRTSTIHVWRVKENCSARNLGLVWPTRNLGKFNQYEHYGSMNALKVFFSFF